MSSNVFFSDLLASISERGRTLLRRAGSSDTKHDASDLVRTGKSLPRRSKPGAHNRPTLTPAIFTLPPNRGGRN